MDIRIAEIQLDDPQMGVADGTDTRWASAEMIDSIGLPAPVRSIIQAVSPR